MSRYIDLDDTKARTTQLIHGYEVEQWLETIPSIDIVRCRECKYWKSTVQMPNGTEVKCLYGRKADDFCSYGEREGE